MPLSKLSSNITKIGLLRILDDVLTIQEIKKEVNKLKVENVKLRIINFNYKKHINDQ